MLTLPEYKQMHRLAHAKATAASALFETTEKSHPDYAKRKSDCLIQYWRYRTLCTAIEQIEYRYRLHNDTYVKSGNVVPMAQLLLLQAGVACFNCDGQIYITA